MVPTSSGGSPSPSRKSVAGRRRMARLRAEGGRGARSRDDRRGHGRRPGSRLRLHARQRHGWPRTHQAIPTGNVRRGPARDRPVRGYARRARSPDHVPAGQGRGRGDGEGEPERRGAEPVRDDRGRVARGDARASGRVRPGTVPGQGRRIRVVGCGPGRRWSSRPKGSGPSGTAWARDRSSAASRATSSSWLPSEAAARSAACRLSRSFFFRPRSCGTHAPSARFASSHVFSPWCSS